MGLYVKCGKCSYCNTEGHTLKYCADSSIPNVIQGLEQSIANCYTRNNIMLFLQRQPAIHVRILARKHRLSTSLQKGFLIDRLTPIYYNIHKSVRLSELGVFIHEHLTPVEPLYEINTFRIDQLAHYLYTHLINEVNRIYDEDEDDASTLITKLAYISNTLNTLYREVYHLNQEKMNRYYEWMEYIYEIIMNMHHTLRLQFTYETPNVVSTGIPQFTYETPNVVSTGISQLTYNLQEPGDETPSTPNRPDITPYILVSSSRTFRNTIESCPICYDDIHPNEKIQFKCGHMLCNKCTHIHVNTGAPNIPQCVLCRAEIREIYTTNKTIYAEWDL